MDYNDDSGNGEHWNWQGENYCIQKESNYDATEGIWNDVALNEEDISYMLDETTTPVKACGDLAYHVNDTDDKELEECRESSSQIKRRRMLQFVAQSADSPLCHEDISSVFLQSNASARYPFTILTLAYLKHVYPDYQKIDEREDSLDEILPQASDWMPGFSDVSASSYEVLDQSSERWLANCINDTDMDYSPNDMNFPGASDIQIDISEFCSTPIRNEANVIQKRLTRSSRNVIIKGKKTLIRPPTKLASSIVYPFNFIKPCGFHGDVTLKDINQKILTPPPSKSKQTEDDPSAYPTSAFSGKPVVGKTKIRTEGGKGSITIMRTKG